MSQPDLFLETIVPFAYATVKSRVWTSVKTAVTPKEILDRVAKIADTRLDETIERLMVTLRKNHCKGKWRIGCTCEFCEFIKGNYTEQKLRVHRLKRKIDRLEDYWTARDWEVNLASKLRSDLIRELTVMSKLVDKKKQFVEQTTV